MREIVQLLAMLAGAELHSKLDEPEMKLIEVTNESDPAKYLLATEALESWKQESGMSLESDVTVVYGNSGSSENFTKIPYVLVASNCKLCGSKIATELRRVGDFVEGMRKEAKGVRKDGGPDVIFGEVLPKNPFVISTVTPDGTHLALYTFDQPGQIERDVYPEILRHTLNRVIELFDISMTIARMASGKTCKEAEQEESLTAAAQN